MDWINSLRKPNYWLLALTAAVVALHLTLLDKADKQNLLSLSILIWLAIASLLWDKRHDLKLDSGVFSTLGGIILIAIVLLRSIAPSGYHLTFSPFLCGIGLVLMASGVKRLHLYWKELLILAMLACYPIFAAIIEAMNARILTAQFSNFMLWLSGFESHREGVFIHLPTGSVEVYGACSGIDSMILMLNISVLFFLLIPIQWMQRIVCLIVAITLGFFINSIRIALLAVLVASGNKESFEYWHGDDGSLIFAMISVFIFGMYCWFAYVRQFNLDSDEAES